MRQAEAEVGDDAMADDPAVNELEEIAADMFGMEAALFVPTGTMSNLIAVMVHCRERGDEMIVGDLSHLHICEQGGSAQIFLPLEQHELLFPSRSDGAEMQRAQVLGFSLLSKKQNSPGQRDGSSPHRHTAHQLPENSSFEFPAFTCVKLLAHNVTNEQFTQCLPAGH